MLDAPFVIFTILTELRRGVPPDQLWKTFSRFRERLSPRLPFWYHLCQQIGLLGASAPYRPSRMVKTWLTLPPKEQTLALLETWLALPKKHTDRAARQALLLRLKEGATLKTRDQRDLVGLQALGICFEEKLGAWGKVVLLGEPEPSPHSPAPWYLENNTLCVPFPANLPLLWELEAFLRPSSRGKYPLDQPNLRRAAQRGAALPGSDEWESVFIHILETDLGASIPSGLRSAILGQPVVHVLEGTFLEFSSPDELKRLRRSPILREHFEQILSPRHVYIEAQKAAHLMKLLEQRGLYARNFTEEGSKVQGQRTYFRRPVLSMPGKSSQPLPDLLMEYQRLQQALDILYHAPGSLRPEHRRITPLLMEERRGQVYVTAYCHTRRAQRTFRLDRIEIPGGP
jgi:hypothetical protein